MQIRKMTAAFGRLNGSVLAPEPGLNIITAPNESGKSTWSRFLFSMFYGVSTRDRGETADRFRYAPWNGSPMEGRMDLVTDDGEALTLLRRTARSGAPMGAFSCTYTGTDVPADGITAQNAGEQLLGVPGEIFRRSAFIGQAGLAVDQDAELERRIASLLSSGEENLSCSETAERLKKQLHRRRHNKTGLLPALEREIAGLDGDLEQLRALRSQHEQLLHQTEGLRAQAGELRDMQRRWEQAELRARWDEYRAAEQAERDARAAAENFGPLPEEAQLAGWSARYDALEADALQADRARADMEAAKRRADEADAAWRADPLYPADEEGLRSRTEELPPLPSPVPVWLCLAAAVLAAAAVFLVPALRLPALWQTVFAGVFAAAAAGAAAFWIGRRRAKARRAAAQALHDEADARTAAYLPLRQAARDAADEAAAAGSLYSALCLRLEEGRLALLAELAPWGGPDSTAEEILLSLRQRQKELTRLCAAAQEAAVRRQTLAGRLPAAQPPEEPVETPSLTPAQLEAALEQTKHALGAQRSRLDVLLGQIRSFGNEDDLLTRRAQKAAERDRLQKEYDALALALEALDTADVALQSRFSPALGRQAAEIFAALTGGRYQNVLLGRDFSLAAEAEGDSARRSVLSLSQGAADQLYLAVRLAICHMVLPRDRSVPLVLDDALVTFDDERLRAALDYLAEEGQRRQILLFTCQRREADYLAGRPGVAFLTL